MALSNSIKEKISIEVIKTLITRFESFPEDSSSNRNAPFHEAFLNAFSDKLSDNVTNIPLFISLASWLQGLNTTLGQSFFENVSRILCDGEKREYTSKGLGNLKITQAQRDNISSIVANLSNSSAVPDPNSENRLIFQNPAAQTIKAMDFSADIFIENIDSVIAIELKSVKPNSGEMRGEKQKILEGKAALYNLFPNKNIKFYIGFPFDPTVNTAENAVTSHDKQRFFDSIINMEKFFDYCETLLASELWNLLSGENNTMEEILQIINAISTPEFQSKFQFLRNSENRTSDTYITRLQEWNLFSEIELVSNSGSLRQNRNQARVYDKLSFKSDGEYNWERYNTLKRILG